MAQRYRDIVDQLASRARGRVAQNLGAGRLITRDVVVDHEFWNLESSDRISERAEPLHVADVENNEQIGFSERLCAFA